MFSNWVDTEECPIVSLDELELIVFHAIQFYDSDLKIQTLSAGQGPDLYGP